MLIPSTLMLPLHTVSGRGKATGLLKEACAFGKRGMLVHGRSMAETPVIREMLDQTPANACIATWVHAGGEPTVTAVDRLREAIRGQRSDWVAALGGGSVMDLAKAATGLCCAELPAQDYQDGMPLPPSTLPFVACPTTAGTGSEATGVSVLTHEAGCLKKSIRHASHLARLVILDPDLLRTCPAMVTACSGMDALTQAIEAFFSRGASAITDSWAQEAILAVSKALPCVFANSNSEERDALLYGSFLAGMALANARLGLVHGLAHPLGVRFHLAHGHVCALALPHVLRYNCAAAPQKYATLASLLGGDPVLQTAAMLKQLDIKNPFEQAVWQNEDLDGIVAETLESGSTQSNPRPVARQDVISLLYALQH